MESSEDAHISRRDLIFIASLFVFIFLYLSLYLVFASAVPAGEGLGWDGRVYGALAADFSGALERGVIDDYRVNRLVPSLLVWMGRTAIGVTDDSPSTVAKQFQEYNILIVSISFFILAYLSICIRLGRNTTVVLISFMFVNFAALKLWIFMAPQTDTTAFLFGLLLALLIIKRKYELLSIVVFVASFAWPAVFIVCLPLVIWRKPLDSAGISLPPRGLVWVVGALALLSAWVAVYLSPYAGGFFLHFDGWLIVAVVGSVVYAIYAWGVADAIPWGNRWWMPSREWAPAAFYLGLWLVQILIIVWIRTSYSGSHVSLPEVSDVFALSIVKPGLFLLSAIVYWGPSILVALVLLRPLLNAAGEISVGTVIFVLLFFVMMTDSESRHLTFQYPLVIVLLCLALRDRGLSWPEASAIFVSSLIISKAWLPIGMLLERGGARVSEEYFAFPWQWLFMNLGPWMHWPGYFMNIALLVVAAIAGWLTYRATNCLAARRAKARIDNDGHAAGPAGVR